MDTKFIENIAPVALIGVAGYFIFKKLGILDNPAEKDNNVVGLTTPLGTIGVTYPDSWNIPAASTGNSGADFLSSAISSPYNLINPLAGAIDAYNKVSTTPKSNGMASTIQSKKAPVVVSTPYISTKGLTGQTSAAEQDALNYLYGGKKATSSPNIPQTKGAMKNSYASGTIKPSWWK